MLVCSDHVCACIFKTWRGLAFLRTFNLKSTIVLVVFLLLWENTLSKAHEGRKGSALAHGSRQRSSRPHPGKAWQQGWEAGWSHIGTREREQGMGKATRPQSSSTSDSDRLARARSHIPQVPEPSQEGLEIKSSNPWTNEGLSSLKLRQWLTGSLQSPDWRLSRIVHKMAFLSLCLILALQRPAWVFLFFHKKTGSELREKDPTRCFHVPFSN